MSKIFFKNIKYYFNIFLYKKHLKKIIIKQSLNNYYCYWVKVYILFEQKKVLRICLLTWFE
jgi:hypothetical protein